MAKKHTYKKWFQDVKRTLDATLQEAMRLKEELEYQVDEIDAKKTPWSKTTTKRYYKLVQAADDMDRVVGHLVEADEVKVKL